MARIRSIKPEFWTSEQLAECSPHARLLFVGLWSFSDDNGIHPASVPRAKMEVFPADDFSRADVAAMIEELVRARLLREYEVQGDRYWQVTGWHHQKIDQPTFKHPLPDGSLPTNVRRKSTEQDSPNQVHRTSDERSPPERRGEEGKGESPSLRSVSSPDKPDDTPATELILDNVHHHPAGDRLTTAVLDAYHQILPKCQQIAVLNPKRRKRILAADKLARQVCRDQGWPYDPADFWASYFGECAEDAWMRGEVPNPRNAAWKQNLDVLLAEDRFAGIMDRAIAAMRDEDAA